MAPAMSNTDKLIIHVCSFQGSALLAFSVVSVRATVMADTDFKTQADQLYEEMQYNKIVELLNPKKVKQVTRNHLPLRRK